VPKKLVPTPAQIWGVAEVSKGGARLCGAKPCDAACTKSPPKKTLLLRLNHSWTTKRCVLNHSPPPLQIGDFWSKNQLYFTRFQCSLISWSGIWRSGMFQVCNMSGCCNMHTCVCKRVCVHMCVHMFLVCTTSWCCIMHPQVMRHCRVWK